MKKDDGKDSQIRQVIISSLNESVSLLSGFPGEDIEYLSSKALEIMRKTRGEKQ